MKSSALVVATVLLGSLAAGCGSDKTDAITAPPGMLGDLPSPSPSASATPITQSTPAVKLGPFTNPKKELAAFYERLRAAGGMRTVMVYRSGGFSPKYREVMDFHHDPLTWRERVYDPGITKDTIRLGNDLLQRVVRECAPKKGSLSEWYLLKDAAEPFYEPDGPVLASGALPTWALDLNSLEITSRKASGSGWTMRATALLGLSSKRSPVTAKLDAAGLPVEMTFGSRATTDKNTPFYTVTFSYDDVEAVPTVKNPKVTKFGRPDPCHEDEEFDFPDEPGATPLAPPAPAG